MNVNRIARGAIAAWLVAGSYAYAQAPKPDPEAELNAAVAAAKSSFQSGPRDIPLGNQATLKLPEGYQFIPQPHANNILKAMGNSVDETRLGMIIPPDGSGFVVPRYISSGYIKDDEARDWKADELLDSLKQGTEEDNKLRAARGIPEMQIVGWTQKPAYEASTHRLTWAIETQSKGQPNEEHGTNFNTYVLGREGYLSMNLVAPMSQLAANKPYVEKLLVQTSFNPGKTYAEFKSGTDRVAEFGIAALVTGVVAKKLGLFALVAAFALKFIKLIIVGALALGAGIRRFFKRGSPA